MDQAWDTMMPLNTTSNYTRFICDQIYDRLTQTNADGSIEGRLAESWTVNDASDAVTFKLHEDAVWSDGEPVTAEDVVFSYQMYSDPSVEQRAVITWSTLPVWMIPEQSFPRIYRSNCRQRL